MILQITNPAQDVALPSFAGLHLLEADVLDAQYSGTVASYNCSEGRTTFFTQFFLMFILFIF